MVHTSYENHGRMRGIITAMSISSGCVLENRGNYTRYTIDTFTLPLLFLFTPLVSFIVQIP